MVESKDDMDSSPTSGGDRAPGDGMDSRMSEASSNSDCAKQGKAEDEDTAPPTRHQIAVPYTIVIVGMAGAGKSTLGNRLLNIRVGPDDYTEFFVARGGPHGCTGKVKYAVSTDGRLAVVDTPGMPHTTPSETLKHFDDIVKKIRGLEGIHLLLFLAVEDRTLKKEYAYYRTLLKQFNLLPCEKLLVCRQQDYDRRPPSTEMKEEKRAGGEEFVNAIQNNSEMKMSHILHMSFPSPEAEESLEAIFTLACNSVPVPVGGSLRTYAEHKAHMSSLACEERRLEALRERVKRLKAVVKIAKRRRWVLTACTVVAELASFATVGIAGVASGVGVPLIILDSNIICISESEIENAQREIDTNCVDKDELKKAQKELDELEALER